MKFDKVIPKEAWPAEKTQERIDLIMAEITDFNRAMNKIDSQVNDLHNKKQIIQNKISHKWKYIRQLQKQLKEQTNL